MAYPEPVTPPGRGLAEIDRASFTVMEKIPEAEMSALVTVTEKLVVPLLVGAPDIAPADERRMPEGNSPTVTDQV